MFFSKHSKKAVEEDLDALKKSTTTTTAPTITAPTVTKVMSTTTTTTSNNKKPTQQASFALHHTSALSADVLGICFSYLPTPQLAKLLVLNKDIFASIETTFKDRCVKEFHYNHSSPKPFAASWIRLLYLYSERFVFQEKKQMSKYKNASVQELRRFEQDQAKWLNHRIDTTLFPHNGAVYEFAMLCEQLGSTSNSWKIVFGIDGATNTSMPEVFVNHTDGYGFVYNSGGKGL